MKRTIAFVWAAFLSLSPLAASAAGVDVTVSFRHASSGQVPNYYTPTPGSTLTGTWKIIVDATASSTLATFRVAVHPQETIPDGTGSTVSHSKSYPAGSANSDTLSVQWDTREMTRYNGIYQIVATATSHGGNSEFSAVTDLKVNNPPSVPQGAATAIERGVPVVTWAANPEPDIIRYEVLRSEGGGFSPVGTSAGTRFTDSKAPAEAPLRYRVIAVRRSAVTPTGISSPPTRSTDPMVLPAPEVGWQPPMIDTSEPAVLPTLAVESIRARQGEGGFAALLPYAAPAPVVAEAIEEGPYRVPTGSSLQAVVTSNVYKPPFIAAALFLVVSAMHTLRLSRRMLSPAGTPHRHRSMLSLVYWFEKHTGSSGQPG